MFISNKSYLNLFSFLLLAASCTHAGTATESSQLQLQTAYLPDHHNEISLDEAINSKDYGVAPAGVVSGGLALHHIWVKIRIHGVKEAGTYYLSSGSHLISETECYLIGQGLKTSVRPCGKAGSMVPIDQWPIQESSAPLFPIPLQTEKPDTVLLHVHGSLPINVTPELFSKIDLHRMESRRSAEILLYSVISFFILSMLIIMALYSRERIFLYFILILIAQAAFSFALYGSLNFLIQPPHTWALILFVFACYMAMRVLLNEAMILFFRLSIHHPRWANALRTASLLFLLELLAFPFSPLFTNQGYYFTGILNSLLLIAAGSIVFARSNTPARLIILPFIFSELITLFYALIIGGWLDMSVWNWLPDSVVRTALKEGGLFLDLLFLGFFFIASILDRHRVLQWELSSVQSDIQTLKESIAGLILPEKNDPDSPVTKISKQRRRTSLASEEEEMLKEKLDYLLREKKIHHDPELRLESVAAILELRPYQLSDFLNIYMQTSFAEFIARYRITDAAELLKNYPDYPILRIAYDVGFESKSSFNRSFRRVMGITPKDYRLQK